MSITMKIQGWIQSFSDLLSKEPALAAAAVNAISGALLYFHVITLSSEAVAVVMGVLTALSAIAVRFKVTPTVKLAAAPAADPATVPADTPSS